MSSKSSFRNLLLGKNRIESRLEYKYAMLRGQLGLLLGAIMITYIFIDNYNGVTVFIPWYISGIASSTIILYLNRRRLYTFSSITLLVISNLMVFLFAVSDTPEGGVYFFFMANAAIGLVLLNPLNKRLGLLFAALSIFLALLSHFGNIESPVPPPLQTESAIRTSFAINFTIGILATILILYFVMRRNIESEKSLIANQDKLRTLTRELEKSKNRFAMAVEGSKAGIYEWEITTNKVYVSPRWLELLGYSEEDKVDVNLEFFMTLVHPEDAERTHESVQKAIENGSSFENELRMKQKDGSYRWFYDTGMIKSDNGAPVLSVGSITDIHDKKLSDQKLLEQNEELEKTNAELDKFVYSASHDMRAPLSTLLGLLDLAKSSKDPEEVRQYFDMMINRIYTMEGFIQEVTDYSRNTRLEVNNEMVFIKPVIEEVIDSFSFLANESEVKVELEVDAQHKFNTDKARLKVVLNNLIANAIKYHNPYESDRFVKIQSIIEGEYYILKILDNGLGIKDEHMDRIFEMFFRGTEKSGGSGLGLYIVKETLDKMNGAIKCISRPSNGTTFEVLLPINQINGKKDKNSTRSVSEDVTIKEDQIEK